VEVILLALEDVLDVEYHQRIELLQCSVEHFCPWGHNQLLVELKQDGSIRRHLVNVDQDRRVFYLVIQIVGPMEVQKSFFVQESVWVYVL
jgi:hypothetical protein